MRTKTQYALIFTLMLAPLAIEASSASRQDKSKSEAAAPATKVDAVGEEQAAIKATVKAFEDAFFAGDAKALAELFTEDGEAVDDEDESIQGREALEQHYAERFAESTGDKLVSKLDSVRILAPGVARLSGVWEYTPASGTSTTTGHFAAMLVKREGKWLFAGIEEQPEKDSSHYQRLKELEWLVGDWVQETEGAVVMSTFKWSDNQNFLVRTFDVRIAGKPALTGTQRIGWDPLTKQFKSWVFDDQGGYGEGLWMRAGDQWVIKATGVRADGRTATATQVLTYLSKDSMSWKSIDRTRGDQIVDDIEEVIMVKKPPQPK